MSDALSIPAAERSVAAKGQYLAGIEWLRIAACLGVVAFHVGTPARQAALGGLQAFTAITVAFAVRAARTRSPQEFTRSRLRTLGLPWLFWSAVFSFLIVIQAYRHHEPLLGWWKPRMWLIGPVTHLWFLPFALAASLVLGLALRARTVRGVRVALVATILASCLGSRLTLPMPLPQWLSVLPAVAAGVFLARYAPGSAEARRPVVVTGSALVLLELVLLVTGYADAALPQLVGLGLTFAVWTLRQPASGSVLAVSRLSYGVYLLHPVCIEIVMHNWSVSATLRWVLVSAGSLLLVAALRKTPLRAVL